MKKLFILVFCGLMLLSIQPAMGMIHTIDISNFAFNPLKTTVTPGDTVRWVLQDGSHQVVSDPASIKTWDSGLLDTPGQSYEIIFTLGDGPNIFPYHCSLHPSMVDTIFTTQDCAAWFDVNNDGIVLSVADLVELIRILQHVLPLPENIYQADVNGDCMIDAGDIEKMNEFFIFGLSVFPIWPVPTCCYPDTIVGACCLPDDSCSLRSELNCLALGGTYHGDNTRCTPVNPCESCCENRGDANHDGVVDVSDLVCWVDFGFWGVCEIACMEEIDVNSDGSYDVSDLVYFVSFMFAGGAGPVPCP